MQKRLVRSRLGFLVVIQFFFYTINLYPVRHKHDSRPEMVKTLGTTFESLYSEIRPTFPGRFFDSTYLAQHPPLTKTLISKLFSDVCNFRYRLVDIQTCSLGKAFHVKTTSKVSQEKPNLINHFVCLPCTAGKGKRRWRISRIFRKH